MVCPITPTPALPHDHDPDPLARRIDIDGADYPYLDQLVRAGLATPVHPSSETTQPEKSCMVLEMGAWSNTTTDRGSYSESH